VTAGHLPGGGSGVLRSATFGIIIQVETLFYFAFCHKAVHRCHI
jgi:hypothetical protein